MLAPAKPLLSALNDTAEPGEDQIVVAINVRFTWVAAQ